MPALVHETELLWVVETVEPAATREIATHLPINQNSAYVRLRSLDRRGYLDRETTVEQHAQVSRWWLTDRGRERVAEGDLPPAGETDFGEYFSGRTHRIEPSVVLEELAVHGSEEKEGWVPSSALYGALPFSKVGIRKKLHGLRDEGWVEQDTDREGRTHHWRLTEAGSARLEEADSVEATPSWLLL
jgi:predicted ArsR family transcriptional regulator